MQTKMCTGCGKTFPATLEYFNRKGRGNDALRPKCKACEKYYRDQNKEHKREVDNIWRRNNSEHKARYMFEYYRTNKKHELERYYRWKEDHISELKAYWREYASGRKDKKREYDKEYRAKFAERIFERKRQWANTNRVRLRPMRRAYAANRKAIEIGAEGCYTKEDIADQYRRQNGKCYYCGERVGNKYHVDHIVPISRGGSNSPDNLVIACPHCNVSKNRRLPHEWGEGGRLL